MFLTTTPSPSASRPRPKLRTPSTTRTAAKDRKSGSHHQAWLHGCIFIEADRNTPSRAGQPQRQPYAAESPAHLQGVEAGLLGGRSRGQLGHRFSEYWVAAIMA
jgi:hypothetical protein